MAAMKQGINIPVVCVVGLIGTLIMVNLVLGVQAWYFWSTDRLMAERAQGARDRDLRLLTAEQTANMTAVRFTDESKQTVAVPIDMAIDMWLADNAKEASGQNAGPVAASSAE
ncbi:MAG: hypothetical protein AAF743_03825 [Planctomycetota bacterium]